MSADRCAEFLKIAPQFALGELPTETPNPATEGLSTLANTDLRRAFTVLKSVDLAAIDAVLPKAREVSALAAAMRDALADGGKIVFCGCGATGRLSLTLEFLWRSEHANDRVASFMAGGDVALIRSIEDFEDAPHFGARQLADIGFGANDLLVASTEGGETPFVIGAAEAAADRSKRPPWFLYCNPDDVLKRRVDRSRRVLENPRIRALSLFCGPMALSGSTRMQATTVLLLAAGAALIEASRGAAAAETMSAFRALAGRLDYGAAAPFTEKEAGIYRAGEFVLYEAPPSLAVTVATDTTERAPTFSLAPFENAHDKSPELSLCRLLISEASDAEDAWRRLLLRPPRALDWPEYLARVGLERLYGYDFSRALAASRRALTDRQHHRFDIAVEDDDLVFSLGDLRASFALGDAPLLSRHLALKLLLNAHSTLVMGRLGRYESNVMTWVRPANNKLIDRAIRYVRVLLAQQSVLDVSYEAAARACFEEIERGAVTDPVVLRARERILKVRAKGRD